MGLVNIISISRLLCLGFETILTFDYEHGSYTRCQIGGMAEWLKAAVLKTVECQSSVGSNPTPSARKFNKLNFTGG